MALIECLAIYLIILAPLGHCTTSSSSASANFFSGLIQNPVVSCQDDKRKILCLPLDYSKFDLPYRNDYNLIDIGIEISDVLKIDDKDYSITFSLYFNVQWSEPRLNLSEEYFASENVTDSDQLIPVNLELIHDLWVPNIYIYNLKSFKVIDVLSKLAGLWINHKKEIYYSQATHITFICPMLFDSFPLDTQVCKFQVGSYSYDMTKMVFKIAKLAFIQKQSIILDYSIEVKNLLESDKIFLAGALGNYSLAGFEMNLQRHVMSYIITYYLPSGLFVVVSWISFLIPPDIVPGRMALLITLFLVLINIFNNITTNSPKAEGLTAIEIWMLACILFVFGSLIEYAVILFRKQKVSKYGIPSQSVYADRASAAAAIAAATQSAAAGAFTLAEGLVNNFGKPLSNHPPTYVPKMKKSPAEDLQELQNQIFVDAPNLQQPMVSSEQQANKNQSTEDQNSESTLRNGSAADFKVKGGLDVPIEAETNSIWGFRQQRLGDSLKLKRKQNLPSSSGGVKKYSTWHDKYGYVDRFFLVCSPFLFLVFNIMYWGYFYVWIKILPVERREEFEEF